jgi:hypothetical protein
LARHYHPGDGRWLRHRGDHAPIWQIEACGVAMASAVHDPGVEGLTRDKTRKPGKKPLPSATMQNVVGLALGPPPGEATHWTGRTLAKAAGMSLRSVQRILEAHQLAPHRIRMFKLSTDPKFAEKLKSASTSIRPPMRSFSRSTRKDPRFRRSTVPSRGCR